MKIKHEHIESVLLALAAEKGQAWVANAITEEYLRQGGGELPLVLGKDWNNQQNIYHRWLKGETNAQREKIQKLIPAVSGNSSSRAASPTLHLRYPGTPCITGGTGCTEYGN